MAPPTCHRDSAVTSSSKFENLFHQGDSCRDTHPHKYPLQVGVGKPPLGRASATSNCLHHPYQSLALLLTQGAPSQRSQRLVLTPNEASIRPGSGLWRPSWLPGHCFSPGTSLRKYTPADTTLTTRACQTVHAQVFVAQTVHLNQP